MLADIDLPGYGENGFDIIFTLGGNDVHLDQDYTPSYDGAGRLTGTWGMDGRNVPPPGDAGLDTSLHHPPHSAGPNWVPSPGSINDNNDSI